MSYLDKHLENEEVAKSLCENDFCDSAINRYYYSIFHLMLHTLDNKGIKLSSDDINSASSHQKAMNSIEGYLRAKGASNAKKCNQIRSNFKDIKKFRKNADYDDEKTKKDDVIVVKSAYNNLKNLLKVI